MDIDFIQNFMVDTIAGQRLCEIKTLVFRDGGVELSPGNIAPCVIPEWLKDQTVEIEVTGGSGTIKSDYGEVEIEVDSEPKSHSVSTDHVAGDHQLTRIQDTDPTHKLTVTFKGRLKDGDPVVVAKHTGLTKYVILCKAEVKDA